MRLSVIGLLLSIYLLTSCGKSSKIIGEKVKAHIPIQTAIEEQLNLDSTQVGFSTIISNLNVPWEIAWGPDNWIWFTEQTGQVSRVNPATGERKVLLTIPDVWYKRTAGLLGMALHPNMKKMPYVVLDYTFRRDAKILSKLVRYTYTQDTLTNPIVLLEVAGNTAHNGSRVTISPDGKIYWATGDAVHSKQAQDTKFYNGKILRLNMDGTIPKDNPIKESAVWAWGYRNIQGLVFASNGNLYTSEHGDATDDEINFIRKGGNYGWPDVVGFCDNANENAYCHEHQIVAPLKAWTPTIAPAGIDYYSSKVITEWQNSLLLTTLKDTDFRVLNLNETGDSIISEKIYFNKELGRLRDLCISPAGDVYISTSNRDWNPAEGYPKEEDDKIIRLFKIKPGDTFVKKEREHAQPLINSNQKQLSPGNIVYNQYCASCHKSDGNGVAGTFPPLRGAEQVIGDKSNLIRIVLQGLSGPIKVKDVEYNQQMPAFGFLRNKELADVLSFIRTEFNNASAVTVEDIKKVRL